MNGIYIHVPFCASKCNYCNFFSVASLSRMQDWTDALTREIGLRKHFFGPEVSGALPEAGTIYFGGGTPSLMEKADLEKIFSALREHFHWQPGAEITLEANPDDILAEKLEDWRSVGFNRLSIGIQSFHNEILQYLTRRHSAQKSISAVGLSLSKGFENLSADLIYGVPGLSDRQWLDDVNRLSDSGVNHISAYALTVEMRTALDYQIRNGKRMQPDDDTAARHFDILRDTLYRKGFEHYEISNFALPGYRSRHNSAYWSRQPYLGLGPSAHSFDGKNRQWNPSHLNEWINNCIAGRLAFESEELTPDQRYNELIITRLRTSDGLNPHDVEIVAGPDFRRYLEKVSQRFIKQGDIEVNEGIMRIVPQKLFVSDSMIVELMYTDS